MNENDRRFFRLITRQPEQPPLWLSALLLVVAHVAVFLFLCIHVLKGVR